MMMKRKDGNNGFWPLGFFLFTDELTKEENSRLAPLQSELKMSTDSARKDELRQEIQVIKTEFKTKRKNAKYSLFAKT